MNFHDIATKEAIEALHSLPTLNVPLVETATEAEFLDTVRAHIKFQDLLREHIRVLEQQLEHNQFNVTAALEFRRDGMGARDAAQEARLQALQVKLRAVEEKAKAAA